MPANSSNITLRLVKGSKLTFQEADDNFQELINIIDDFQADYVLNKEDAVVDPTVNNDSGEGYAPRSLWFNVSSGEIFRCLDSTVGAAVWVKTSLTIDELGALATGDNATDVPYDNTTSALTATNVQAAVDELDSGLDTLSTNQAEITADIDDLITLTGVTENITDLGTFTGTTISDNVVIKTALQELETAVEARTTVPDATQIAVDNAITFAIALG